MSVYGSQEGISHICLSLCDPGDVVLVPNPGYPIFSIGPSLAGAETVTYDLTEENHYVPDLDAMDEELLKRTKCMIVSYPLNPVCKTAPDSFYEKLIPWAIEHNIMIIHDNAYSDIIYDGRVGKSILRIPDAKKIAAVLRFLLDEAVFGQGGDQPMHGRLAEAGGANDIDKA